MRTFDVVRLNMHIVLSDRRMILNVTPAEQKLYDCSVSFEKHTNQESIHHSGLSNINIDVHQKSN